MPAPAGAMTSVRRCSQAWASVASSRAIGNARDLGMRSRPGKLAGVTVGSPVGRTVSAAMPGSSGDTSATAQRAASSGGWWLISDIHGAAAREEC